MRSSQLWRQDNPAFSLAVRIKNPRVSCYNIFRDLQSIESNVCVSGEPAGRPRWQPDIEYRSEHRVSPGNAMERAAPKGLLEP
jgi:hypothetical protein